MEINDLNLKTTFTINNQKMGFELYSFSVENGVIKNIQAIKLDNNIFVSDNGFENKEIPLNFLVKKPFSRNNVWTKKEISILKNNINKVSLEKLVELLPNRTIDAIRKRAWLLRIHVERTHKNYPSGWSDKENEILRKYYFNSTLETLQQFLPGRSKPAIYSQAYRLRLKRGIQAIDNEYGINKKIVESKKPRITIVGVDDDSEDVFEDCEELKNLVAWIDKKGPVPFDVKDFLEQYPKSDKNRVDKIIFGLVNLNRVIQLKNSTFRRNI